MKRTGIEVTAYATALILALLFLVSRADAVDRDRPGALVIIGDSYAGSSTSPEWTWSSAIGAHTGLAVHRYAVGNSGIVKASRRCAGTDYSDRLGALAKVRPKYVIVQDAVNDNSMCRGGSYFRAARWQVRNETDAFMRALAIKVHQLGIPRDHVIVMHPRTHKMRGHQWAGDLMARAAARHRFTMIEPYLTVHQTTSDNVHANKRGHAVLTDVLVDALP